MVDIRWQNQAPYLWLPTPPRLKWCLSGIRRGKHLGSAHAVHALSDYEYKFSQAERRWGRTQFSASRVLTLTNWPRDTSNNWFLVVILLQLWICLEKVNFSKLVEFQLGLVQAAHILTATECTFFTEGQEALSQGQDKCNYDFWAGLWFFSSNCIERGSCPS